jgi:hypothetical protein
MVPAGLPGPFLLLLQYGMEPEPVYSNTRAAFNGIERPSMQKVEPEPLWGADVSQGYRA